MYMYIDIGPTSKNVCLPCSYLPTQNKPYTKLLSLVLIVRQGHKNILNLKKKQTQKTYLPTLTEIDG